MESTITTQDERRSASSVVSSLRPNQTLLTGVRLPSVEPKTDQLILRRHARARAVDNGRLSEELKELHRKRDEMGLTIQDLAEIAGVPVGTVNKRFYDESRDVPNPIREVIEASYQEWIKPENVARRKEIEGMTMGQLVEQWASWIGGADFPLEQKIDLLADSHILDVNPLTIERQVSGKRERWKIQRIMRYEQRVLLFKKGRENRAMLAMPANDKSM